MNSPHPSRRRSSADADVAWTTALSAVLTVLSLWSWPAALQAAPAWQQSESAQIELAVRDRNAHDDYVVVFVVTTPEGRTVRLDRRVTGEQWGRVQFPSDFGTDIAAGHYRWRAEVEGRSVVGGAFRYRVRGGEIRLSIEQ